MSRMIKKYLSAISFLTVLPVSESFSKKFKNSTSFFPLVGLFIGGVLILVNFSGSFLFPKLVVKLMIITSLAIITGGVHLDGLADTLDGFYAGKNKDDTLRIMDDAHLGAMGVIGIFCVLGIKFVALHSIPEKILYQSLLLFPVLSRWALVFACVTSGPSKNEGLGKSFVDTTKKRDFFIATIITLLISIVLFKSKGIIILAAVLLITYLFSRFIIKKIGGLTGDTLGALNEISEVFVLLILCIR